MDPERFDRFSRLLGRSGTRRAALAVLAAATGVAARGRRATAADWCERNGVGLRDCGPGCNDQRTGPCTCYPPEFYYCAKEELGVACRNGEVYCEVQAGYFNCSDPAGCCSGFRCYEQCCHEGQFCDHLARGCQDICTSGPPCQGGCCGEGEVCTANGCAPACAAGRAGRAGGICCNPATEKVCRDRCCSKEDQCCVANNGTATCCPQNKECCVGFSAAACCDPGEAYCCSGVCCANHRVCVGEPVGTCMEECPDGRVKCGRFCCPAAHICINDNGTCSKCRQGETPCERACCGKDEQCKGGVCVARCRKGQTPCGDACCAKNEECKRGRCAKKRKK